ncbi:MAG TPA: carboxypeptidase-like regulatory domain-containing protein [Propionibacteriaceae bacterium]|nr:carboxypeptidase-like regulatory domain-containing protein [Propionibacteriaceae bacterium]
MPRARRPGVRSRPVASRPALVPCLAGVVVAVCAVLPTAGAAPAYAGDPAASASASPSPGTTTLTLQASFAGHGVMSASGTLVGADGRPLGHKVVTLTVDDATMGGATTGADGRWSTRVALPERFPQGVHRVVALYLDDGFGGPVSATTTVQMGNLAATTLTAKSAAKVGRGQTLTVSGRLTTASGSPLPDSAVVVGTPDSTGTLTTAVTESDGSFVVDYRVHEDAGDQRIPVRFDGDDRGKASSTSLSVTVSNTPVPSATPTPTPTASVASSDLGPGDVQPPVPTTPLPVKQRAELTSGPLTSGTNLAIGGVGLLAVLTSLAMLGRAMAPVKPIEEPIRLIDT